MKKTMHSQKYIRKIASFMMVFVFIMTALNGNTLTPLAQQEDIVCYGDVDGNGQIQADDALLVLKHAAKLETIQAGLPAALADVDQNGSI